MKPWANKSKEKKITVTILVQNGTSSPKLQALYKNEETNNSPAGPTGKKMASHPAAKHIQSK
jgi:hypothetical protein